MKEFSTKFLIIMLLTNALFLHSLFAADDELAGQQSTCNARPGFIWNYGLNRCIPKESATELKKNADQCGNLTNLEAKKACEMQVAQQASGVKSDPSKADMGNTQLLVSTAYGIIGISMALGVGGASKCTSRSIFQVVSIAGMAADFFIKFKAKSKAKELKEKYQIDLKTNKYYAQSKALEYLKEEQAAIIDLAKKEKMRSLALTVGYLAASVMAIFEITPYGQTAFPECNMPEKPTT